MNARALVAGGGIGGLAAAIACARSGTAVDVFEQAGAFAEIGAGIQLGPNAVRILRGWGLEAALLAVAAQPARLVVRGAQDGRELASLPLGADFTQRYGAPYLTVHRADLHAVLLAAARGSAQLHTGCTVSGAEQDKDGVSLAFNHALAAQGDLLVGADGLWSTVRSCVLPTSAPRATGHLAYRALLPLAALPAALRSSDVTAWLGAGLHAVQYPVRGGDALNLVVVVEGSPPAETEGWDHAATAAGLQQALADAAPALRSLAAAAPQWRLWALCDRPAVQGAQQMARERIALLGDAAHPMVPYLAQGAAMALEDAHALEASLREGAGSVQQRLASYAARRWARSARVQERALRNGRVFHLRGPLRMARDAAMRVLGPRLLDQPWLYGGPEG